MDVCVVSFDFGSIFQRWRSPHALLYVYVWTNEWTSCVFDSGQ